MSIILRFLRASSKWRLLSQYFATPSLAGVAARFGRDPPSSAPATSPYNVEGIHVDDLSEDPLTFRRQHLHEADMAGLPNAAAAASPEGITTEAQRTPGSAGPITHAAESNSGSRAPGAEHGAVWSNYFSSLPSLPSLPKLFPGRRNSCVNYGLPSCL